MLAAMFTKGRGIMRLPLTALGFASLLLTATPALHAEDAIVRDFKAVDASFTRHPIPYTGNADVDFRKSLIARRENIINMAEVALSRGEDPSTQDLAMQTIAKQKRDIAELQRWLDTHPSSAN